MARKRDIGIKPATSLLEEALHLLRSCPPGLFVVLYAGCVPFILGFLYFWTDMSKGAQAEKNASLAALVIAVLFVWMKACQAHFSSRLRERLLMAPHERWGIGRWARTYMFQAAWQPTGFIALPIAALATVPFGWVYAFYRNLTVFGTGASGQGARQSMRAALRQSGYAQRQNHVVLIVLGLSWALVFVNIMQLAFIVPFLIKTLLGIESIFTVSGFSMFNTTLVAVCWGAAYLVMEPIVNAAYTLRCFYGESMTTGEDLICELAAFKDDTPKSPSRAASGARAAIAAVLIAAAALALSPSCARAAGGEDEGTLKQGEATVSQSKQAHPQPHLKKAQVEGALDGVLSKRHYQWRMPRQKVAKDQKKGPFYEFFRSLGETISGWARTVGRWGRSFADWISKIMPKFNPATGGKKGSGIGISPDLLVMILFIVIAALAAVVIYRVINNRSARLRPVSTTASAPLPDIEDEATMADALASNQWLDMVADLMGRGQKRLALRALYLACLARLAEDGLILIAPYKANRDYMREVLLRSHALPGLHDAFAANVGMIDRVWYGQHEATDAMVRSFSANNERIFGIAKPAGQ